MYTGISLFSAVIILCTALHFADGINKDAANNNNTAAAVNVANKPTTAPTTLIITAQILAPTKKATELTRKERKQLRRKRKRLRKLRAQVRELRAQLFPESKSPPNENNQTATIGNRVQQRKQPRLNGGAVTGEDRKWRKKIMRELAVVVRRLDRLEADSGQGANAASDSTDKQTARKELREQRRRRRQQQKKLMMTGAGKQQRQRLLHVTDGAKATKHSRLQQSISQSRNGDQGGGCGGHRDCKPGLCCHWSPANATRVCILHGNRDGVVCQDSCQCQSGLHCFRRADYASHIAALPADEETVQATARCKKASMEDVVRGVYMNNKNGAFDTLPFT